MKRRGHRAHLPGGALQGRDRRHAPEAHLLRRAPSGPAPRRRHGRESTADAVVDTGADFEKAVTPSDVGKLNRLVVPKQHAEKHFPLKRAPDATTGKGVLLNFEDGQGKVWRFRYSYWNSSQSYVLTKGWSRFVREKGLRAGDTIVFSRSAYGPDKQLFIDCKKNKTTCTDGGDTSPVEKGKEARVVMLFGVDIAGDGCQKRGRAVEMALEQGQEFFKMQCVGAHQHSPALGAFVL